MREKMIRAICRESAHHRRSVAACLGQGVYILERDRQEKRLGLHALAPPSWEFFHFQLLRHLVDVADSSIFGAIYEFKPPASHCNHYLDGSPRYVIAFRGTLNKPDSISRDLELGLRVIQNGLHKTSRFEIALQAVRNMVAAVGDANVWLAGHSLGSAMAMLAGKTMAKSATLALAKAEQQRNVVEDSFAAFSAWFPCLFVNPADHICSEDIGYFEHRKKMEEIGAGGIERIATQNSLIGLFMNAPVEESEPLHLIPSASLTINLTHTPDFKQAHGLLQWWTPDLPLQFKLYDYRQLLSQ